MTSVTIGADGEDALRANLEKAQALLNERTYVSALKTSGSTLSLTTKDGGSAAPEVLGLLHENQVAVTNLSVATPTLDDVFFQYTGRSIRAEEASGDEVEQMTRPRLGLKRR